MVFLVGWIARELPPDRRVPFLADPGAHSASYLVRLVGGIVVLVWHSRGRTPSFGRRGYMEGKMT